MTDRVVESFPRDPSDRPLRRVRGLDDVPHHPPVNSITATTVATGSDDRPWPWRRPSPYREPVEDPVIACVSCGARNRVPTSASGSPRCAKCHADLPWLVEVGDAEFAAAVVHQAAGAGRSVGAVVWSVSDGRAGAREAVARLRRRAQGREGERRRVAAPRHSDIRPAASRCCCSSATERSSRPSWARNPNTCSDPESRPTHDRRQRTEVRILPRGVESPRLDRRGGTHRAGPCGARLHRGTPGRPGAHPRVRRGPSPVPDRDRRHRTNGARCRRTAAGGTRCRAGAPRRPSRPQFTAGGVGDTGRRPTGGWPRSDRLPHG